MVNLKIVHDLSISAYGAMADIKIVFACLISP